MKKILIMMFALSLILVAGCSDDTEEADDTSNENASEVADDQSDEYLSDLTEEEKKLIENIEGMEETAIEAEENPQTLEGFKEAYKNAGYEVGNSEEVDYNRFYADDGIKFEIDGQVIEIYKYDDAINMSDEADNFITYPEDRPPMTFDGTDTPTETMYGDKYMGISDDPVPGFLLLYGKDHEPPIQPAELYEDTPDALIKVFMGYSLTGNSAPEE